MLVVGFLFLLISFRVGSIQAGVANLALLLPVGYAFAAGLYRIVVNGGQRQPVRGSDAPFLCPLPTEN